MIKAETVNTLNIYVMSKLFPLNWFEIQRFLGSQIFYSKIESEISDKIVTFQGIFELQTHPQEKFLKSQRCLRYSKDQSRSHNFTTH